MSEQTKDTSVEPEATSPAWKRLMRWPRRVMTKTPPKGAKSAIQAAGIIRGSSPKRSQPVDVELDPLARDRHDQAEPHDRLRCGHDHHREREDLSVAVARVAGEGEKRQVPCVQHDLERKQDDERTPPDAFAVSACGDEEHRDDEVGGGAGAGHRP